MRLQKKTDKPKFNLLAFILPVFFFFVVTSGLCFPSVSLCAPAAMLLQRCAGLTGVTFGLLLQMIKHRRCCFYQLGMLKVDANGTPNLLFKQRRFERLICCSTSICFFFPPLVFAPRFIKRTLGEDLLTSHIHPSVFSRP